MPIRIRNARTHHLKGIDLDLPSPGLTVVRGVAGSGKSSLVWDTIYADSQCRYLEALGEDVGIRWDPPPVDRIENLPPALGYRESRVRRSLTLFELAGITNPLQHLFVKFGKGVCVRCQSPVEPFDDALLERWLESHPEPAQKMVGFQWYDSGAAPENLIRPLIKSGIHRVWIQGKVVRLEPDCLPTQPIRDWIFLVDRLKTERAEMGRWRDALVLAFQLGQGTAITWDPRFSSLVGEQNNDSSSAGKQNEAGKRIWKWGYECPSCDLKFVAPSPGLFDPRNRCRCQNQEGAGCPNCEGTTWPATVRGVRLAGQNYPETLRANSQELLDWMKTITQETSPLSDSIHRRCALLAQYDLAQHPGDTTVGELSPGETRRAMLSGFLATDLPMMMVLDAPHRGLHPRHRAVTNQLLQGLRDEGRTVLVADQDPELANLADLVLELEGGHLISPTHKALSSVGKKNATRLTNKTKISPETLTVIQGDLGSKYLQRLAKEGGELLDSAPLHRSRKGSPLGVVGAFQLVCALFAESPEAKRKGWSSSSFNLRSQTGLRCPECEGTGVQVVDLELMADLVTLCPECRGKRYQREALEVRYRSINLSELLHLSSDEALSFFRGQPKIQRKVQYLRDIGLGRIPIGQSLETISSGESQLLKLAGLLARKRPPGSTLLLEEPVSGMHPQDIERVVAVLRNQISAGHTIICAENEPLFGALADHVIEFTSDAST